MNFNEKVYDLCKKIPRGRVSTYGEIAKAMDSKAYRAVGRTLKNNQHPDVVPCHRVLNSKGELYGFKGKKDKMSLKSKKELLEQEGIRFDGDFVVNFKNVFYKLR